MTATSGAITHTLHRLEYAGLGARLVNPDDGRSLYVALTRRGLELTDTGRPAAPGQRTAPACRSHPDEQRTLAHLLRKLLLGFERDQPAPAPRPARRATGQHWPRQG
jgi:DNA-binding MarR family transcriptional regulator